MSTHKVVVITCDVNGCESKLQTEHATVADARREAKQIGWQVTRNETRDICPACWSNVFGETGEAEGGE